VRALALAVALALTAAGTAHADRTSSLGVVAGMGVDGALHDEIGDDPEAGALLGVSLAWERSLPAFPDPGVHVGIGDIAPELSLIGYHHDAMLLAGLRLQLLFANNRVPPFGVTDRGHLWLTPRVGVSTQADTVIVGADSGLDLAVHDDWTLGLSLGFYSWRESAASCGCTAFGTDPPPEATPLRRYLGFQVGLTLSAPI
jgi:hypothetical protein